MTHPDASWKYTAAEYNSDIFEKKFAQAHAGTFGQPGVLLMGTGPWKVDSFDPTRGATLSANPHWWGGKVPVQKVTFTFFANETSLGLAMRSGSIDLTPYVDSPKSFKTAPGATLLTSPSCDINTLIINRTRSSSPSCRRSGSASSPSWRRSTRGRRPSPARSATA